jgi:D-alanine-D-alanine ligase
MEIHRRLISGSVGGMRRKVRIGILCGGRSAEHEVSLQSAKNIVESIDREKYDVVLIGIDKQGQWHRREASGFLRDPDDPKSIRLHAASDHSAVIRQRGTGHVVGPSDFRAMGSIDVVFPVLHGPFGEDGTVQGLMKLVGVPFVGASVLGSAVTMDKDVSKRLLRDAGIPTTRFLVLDRSSVRDIDFHEVENRLGLPVFVKPANLGSSVATSKVRDRDRFERAIDEAFAYDNKILLEEYIEGRELECSVLGNDSPIASVPGEIIPRHEFYSYEAKYLDEEGAALEIPAKVDEETTCRIQDLAVRTFRVLCCEGMARVDFFLKYDGEVVVNEMNTIPGFTKISMYPKLWEASGIPQPELIDRLVELALERFEKERRLKTSY